VWNAKSDIKRLKDHVKTLNTTAKSVKRLLEDPDAAAFETVQELVDSLSGSLTLLKQLQDRLDSDKARKPMSLIGVRALKWPYDRKEIEAVIASLENYEQTISHALQVDHM
jgi:hypothetical protein